MKTENLASSLNFLSMVLISFFFSHQKGKQGEKITNIEGDQCQSEKEKENRNMCLTFDFAHKII